MLLLLLQLLLLLSLLLLLLLVLLLLLLLLLQLLLLSLLLLLLKLLLLPLQLLLMLLQPLLLLELLLLLLLLLLVMLLLLLLLEQEPVLLLLLLVLVSLLLRLQPLLLGLLSVGRLPCQPLLLGLVLGLQLQLVLEGQVLLDCQGLLPLQLLLLIEQKLSGLCIPLLAVELLLLVEPPLLFQPEKDLATLLHLPEHLRSLLLLPLPEKTEQVRVSGLLRLVTHAPAAKNFTRAGWGIKRPPHLHVFPLPLTHLHVLLRLGHSVGSPRDAAPKQVQDGLRHRSHPDCPSPPSLQKRGTCYRRALVPSRPPGPPP